MSARNKSLHHLNPYIAFTDIAINLFIIFLLLTVLMGIFGNRGWDKVRYKKYAKDLKTCDIIVDKNSHNDAPGEFRVSITDVHITHLLNPQQELVPAKGANPKTANQTEPIVSPSNTALDAVLTKLAKHHGCSPISRAEIIGVDSMIAKLSQPDCSGLMRAIRNNLPGLAAAAKGPAPDRQQAMAHSFNKLADSDAFWKLQDVVNERHKLQIDDNIPGKPYEPRDCIRFLRLILEDVFPTEMSQSVKYRDLWWRLRIEAHYFMPEKMRADVLKLKANGINNNEWIERRCLKESLNVAYEVRNYILRKDSKRFSFKPYELTTSGRGSQDHAGTRGQQTDRIDILIISPATVRGGSVQD